MVPTGGPDVLCCSGQNRGSDSVAARWYEYSRRPPQDDGVGRAWPSPRHRAAAPFVSALDARFAAQTDQLGLLLPSLDALDEDGPGRPGAPGDLCEGSFWRFEGVLWKSQAAEPASAVRAARMRRASCSRGRTPKSVAHLIARLCIILVWLSLFTSFEI